MCVKNSNWRIFHQSRSWRKRVTNSHHASIPNSFKDSCSSSCLRTFVVSFSMSVIQKMPGASGGPLISHLCKRFCLTPDVMFRQTANLTTKARRHEDTKKSEKNVCKKLQLADIPS